jgi:hypothetical protein
MFGGDYDGRLGPLTDWINRCPHLFKDKTILDLGSNAGHFPIEYMRAGARKVIAVEGRPEFETQWHGFKDLVPHVDLNAVDWVTADVRTLEASGYNMISCLGLLYHMVDYLPKLKGLSRCVEIMLVEISSPISGTVFRNENSVDRTCGLEPEKVEYKSHHNWERAFVTYFNDEFNISRVWAYLKGRVTSLYRAEASEGNRFGHSFNIEARLLYVFHRTPIHFPIDKQTGCLDVNHQDILIDETVRAELLAPP